LWRYCTQEHRFDPANAALDDRKSIPANVISLANISPVGPPAAITTAGHWLCGTTWALPQSPSAE
jgi:hypothetical protein